MSVFDGQNAASLEADGRPWEELLLRPGSVCLQFDTSTGCGPACLAMALALEAGADPLVDAQDQATLAARCQAACIPDHSAQPYQWATSPAVLAHVLNNQPQPDQPRRHALHQYHIVHAASPRGPIEEILAWLQPPPPSVRRRALPSFLLARHGTHWLLAVGAKVTVDGLDWLAAADPTTGQLRCFTAAGLAGAFTPNLVGHHPDWTNRHVAVIPSVLPRRLPGNPPLATPSLVTPTPPRPAVRPPLPTQPTDLVPGFSPAEESQLLDTLSGIARHTSHPLAQDWLVPLLRARHVVADQPATRPPDNTTRRAWALDAELEPIAELRFQGTPATLLHFSILSPAPAPHSDRSP